MTSETVQIVPYRAADRAAVDAFNAALQEFERQFYPELRPGHEMGPYTDLILRKSAAPNGLVLIAKAGSRSVGFICGWIDEGDEVDELLVRADERRRAYVSDLFVEADWRRRGIAHRLLGEFEAEMSRRGCRRVKIASRGENGGALRCYEDYGFRPFVVIFDKPTR